MRGPQVAAFAEKHGLKRISVADLIAYRQAREKLVERVARLHRRDRDRPAHGLRLPTPFDSVHHFAFVHGRIGDGANVPTRLHRADVVADMFGGARTIRRVAAPLQARRAAA